MRRSFWAALCGKKHLLLEVNPVGSTFNIQNSIPHKSQKPKAVAETNRAKEFQKGTAGVPESAKEGARPLAEGSDIGLGPRDRAFEPHYSDQRKKGLWNHWFQSPFSLFNIYCEVGSKSVEFNGVRQLDGTDPETSCADALAEWTTLICTLTFAFMKIPIFSAAPFFICSVTCV